MTEMNKASQRTFQTNHTTKCPLGQDPKRNTMTTLSGTLAEAATMTVGPGYTRPRVPGILHMA
jgi:hypothetical protein